MSKLTEAATHAASQVERVFDDNEEIGSENAVGDVIEGVRAAEEADTASKWGSIGAVAGVVGASRLRRRLNRDRGEGDALLDTDGERSGVGAVRDLVGNSGTENDVEIETADVEVDVEDDEESESGGGLLSSLKRSAIVLAAAAGLAVAFRRLRSNDDTLLQAGDEDGRGDLGLGSPETESDAPTETIDVAVDNTDEDDGDGERETPERNTPERNEESDSDSPGRGDLDEDERATTSADAEVELGSDDETGQHVQRGSTTDEETGRDADADIGGDEDEDDDKTVDTDTDDEDDV